MPTPAAPDAPAAPPAHQVLSEDLAWKLANHYRADETGAAGSDRRFSCHTAQGPGRTFATILHCASVAALSPSLRALLGITTTHGPAMIIGGGSLGAGALYEDPAHPGSLADLVRQERAAIGDPDLFVVAPSVPEYVPAHTLSSDGTVRRGSQRLWYYQRLSGYRDLREYIGDQDRKIRQTLARDTRVAQDLHTEAVAVTADDPALQNAALLFAAVERNNGEPGDARLTAWRVRTLLRATRRSFLLTLSPAPHEAPLSYTLLRELVPGVLDVSMIGIAHDTPGRRDLYHVGAFTLPLRFAIAHGFELALFGREHPGPKKLRGLRELRGVDAYPHP